MAAKVVAILVCAQIFLQMISAQCIGAAYDAGWNSRRAAPLAGPALASPLAAVDYPGYSPYTLAASNGGGFAVSSASPIAPTGVVVQSENIYDGPVYVAGHLPFLSVIALEGPLPSLGAGVVSYGCGDGNVAILSEEIAPASPVGPCGYGSIGPGYGPGLYGGPLGFGGCRFGLFYCAAVSRLNVFLAFKITNKISNQIMLLRVIFPMIFQILFKQIAAQCIPACGGLISSQAPLEPFLSSRSGVPPLSAAISPIAAAEAMGFPRGFAPSFRSGFAIQSNSPVSASGLSIRSENAYEGPIQVAGRLPFLSAVAVEGMVPSVGAGGVLYGCAAKDFGIVSEDFGPVVTRAGGLPGGPVYSGRVVL
ncbi:uncharacterized protein LOC121736080 [Aricia agestis]|uniref:uncharacterized protein LOC121736080 n=1 Tax=Aricia agestis TaxID=91739 RepID=UPI001C2082AD|nr:uncharacterized protein LOC121736080 [Aricia agestis]